jgi:hypothetical protein
MEAAARAALRPVLADFDGPLADIYEAGVQAPTLPGRHTVPSLRLAAFFLKRALLDLRATWQLVTSGYTSSGASVEASLVEHALAAEVLAAYPERVTELSEYGDIPWSPRKLAQLASAAAAVRDGSPQLVATERSRNIYAAYKWLCKVKHPTLRSTLYGAQAHGSEDGAFVVMAAPDMRQADLPVKRVLLTIVLGRTVQAIKAFVAAVEPERDDPIAQDFSARFHRGEASLLAIAAQDSQERLPFGLTRAEAQAL